MNYHKKNMNEINIYCLSLFKSDYKNIINKNYIPVGLGNDGFGEDWLTDRKGYNISEKNPYYGEYTFHYNLWKNNIIDKNYNGWIGFCTYRRFWLQDKKKTDLNLLDENFLKEVPDEWKNNYDSVLVEPIFTNKTKLSKIIKHGKKNLIKNPFLFLNKENITIKIHFDMYHGYGNLDKAIDQLSNKDKEKFRKFVNTETCFNPYNMFICKNKKLLFDYYREVFPWLEKCEKIFGFDLGESYGQKRIYGFLAERYLSYWFKTYANPINWPIYFKDRNF